MREYLMTRLPTWEQVQEWLIDRGGDFLFRRCIALGIFFAGKWLATRLSRFLVHFLERYRRDATLSVFLGRLIQGLLWVAVGIIALETAGFKTSSLLAVLGGAVLAVGLALKDSLSNFAAGVMIIVFRPFSMGDFIEVNGGLKGSVEEIATFYTRLRTPDNLTVIIPNSQIGVGQIINYSLKNIRRVDLIFGVSYNDDLKLAKETIWNVLNKDARILKDPPAVVGVDSLGDNSVNITCYVWVKSAQYLDVKFYLNETIKVELEAAGCSIPYPQRDLHLFYEKPKAEDPEA